MDDHQQIHTSSTWLSGDARGRSDVLTWTPVYRNLISNTTTPRLLGDGHAIPASSCSPWIMNMGVSLLPYLFLGKLNASLINHWNGLCFFFLPVLQALVQHHAFWTPENVRTGVVWHCRARGPQPPPCPVPSLAVTSPNSILLAWLLIELHLPG